MGRRKSGENCALRNFFILHFSQAQGVPFTVSVNTAPVMGCAGGCRISATSLSCPGTR